MSQTPRASLFWRTLLAILAGVTAGAFSGAVDGLAASIKSGGDLQASLLVAGLFAPMGFVLSVAAVFLVWLVFGADPVGRLGRAWQETAEDPFTASRFAAKSLAIGGAVLIFIPVVFHLSKKAMTAFHHMGLAAMLLVAASVAIALLLFLTAVRIAPVLDRTISRFSTRALRPLAVSSILLVPAVFLVATALSPVDGSGLLGFMGLLKREELELAFIAWTIVPSVSAVLAFAFLRRVHIRWAASLFAIFSLGSLAAFCFTAFGMDSNPRAVAAIEENSGMGRRLLALYRASADGDGDGFAALFGGGDCDDSNPNRWPGAIDIRANGVDEDCSGADAAAMKPSPVSPEENGRVARRSGGKDLSLVILSIDALRWDLGFMGYERPITPNIDELAAKSVVFERAYALSSFTGRSLAPMFIGRYPSETYCDYSHFTKYSPENDMLAEVLKRDGFATAGVGSHYYFKGYGLEQGFDRYFVEVPKGKLNIDQKVTSDLVADRALEILSDETFISGRFFLWAHFMDPHRDYIKHEGIPDFGDSGRDRYDNEVAFADHHAGRVIEKLKELNLWDRTVVMVTGDHGEAFGEHDVSFHGRRLWEEIVRVPWIWKVPGVEARRVKARVSHVDLVATVCDLLGARPSEQSRGRTLVPLMEGAKTEDRRVFIEQLPGPYMEEWYAYIEDGDKLIHKIVGNRFLLFNLEEDPSEKQDLSASKEQRLEQIKEVYRNLRSGLERNAPRQPSKKR